MHCCGVSPGELPAWRRSPFGADGDGDESLLSPQTGIFQMFYKGFFSAYSMNFKRKRE